MNDWQKLKKRKLEAPPTLAETTSNLQTPEVIGGKLDKRTLRKTGRTEQFATRVSKEWLEKVRGISEKENLKLVEVLERSLECYEQEKKIEVDKELEKYRKIIEPKPKKVFFHPNKNFSCDKCGASFQDETAYSYSSSLGKFTETYCGGCSG